MLLGKYGFTTSANTIPAAAPSASGYSSLPRVVQCARIPTTTSGTRIGQRVVGPDENGAHDRQSEAAPLHQHVERQQLERDAETLAAGHAHAEEERARRGEQQHEPEQRETGTVPREHEREGGERERGEGDRGELTPQRLVVQEREWRLQHVQEEMVIREMLRIEDREGGARGRQRERRAAAPAPPF